MEKLLAATVIAIVLMCTLPPCVFSRPDKVLWKKLFPLSQDCEPIYVVVDDHELIEMRSSENQGVRRTASAGTSCLAYFVTRKEKYGLCVRMRGSTIIYSDHAKIEFLTGPYSPDMIIRRYSKRVDKFCTPHRLLVVRVSTSGEETNLDRDFSYTFQVENVTRDSITDHYYMDSFAECGVEHELASGQEVIVEAERDPHVTASIPDTCELTFTTTSDDEYEQVCVEFDGDDFVKDAGQSKKQGGRKKSGKEESTKGLMIKGLYSRFYKIEEAMEGTVVCSENRSMTLLVNRTVSDYKSFTATITSRRHVYWDTEAREAAELGGLRVVKGITYFIATIDSLVAVVAALLSAVLKRPRGPWKRWAENFNANVAAHAPQSYPATQDPNSGTYTSHKDGSYPELPVEMPPPTNEVLVEAHTY